MSLFMSKSYHENYKDCHTDQPVAARKYMTQTHVPKSGVNSMSELPMCSKCKQIKLVGGSSVLNGSLTA